MFEKIDVDKLFKKFRKQKVLIIGDVMIDSYLWGRVDRISPEAPVPVLSNIHVEKRLGGAANVALNIKAMGAVPILCSVIGDDDRGNEFIELMNYQNLTDIGIIIDKKRVTTRKTRVISGNQHLLRLDEEQDDPITGVSQAKVIEFAQNMLSEGQIDSIIFQDYDKGAITPKIINEVVKLANQKKVPVLVDPKKRNFLLYENISLFKPNFKELNQGLKAEIDKHDMESIANAMENLRKSRKHEMVMVTLSELGIMINEKNKYHHISAEIRDIADVSGAGDSVISLASLCLGVGLSPREIAALSNLAGGQVCERAGVVPVDRLQLMQEFRVFLKEME
ncbi:MAG: D-glycero-beta-D-manno-heptose-7-phosphate kinase [Bacteroidales bacterium]|nr:D-glycero-beta-D-manno-heptose-7-phosphate kinase [Bacteroidales bacterium]MCB8998660.1 D-glycero-beta-D-manno-heptose-7-phosphate kinase [Bacteroidales bacterium]MCB9012472.1 D-glycero-beta-D-manno-heptose-7-phosphate kinase [Bacteroidales bacterium]